VSSFSYRNYLRICIFACLFFTGKTLSAYNDYIFPISSPDFSNYGTIGLIQVPTSRFEEEGTLAFSWTHNDPYLRGSIVAYPFNWLEASYQYVDINNQLYSSVKEFSGSQSLKDKSFDFKVRLLKETQSMPSIALGFRDIGGTNLFGAEYLTFSKYINNFDFTFGLGWGNLNGNNIKNPLLYVADRFESRGNPKPGGGQLSTDTFFSGKAGYFGGFEYFIPKFGGARLKFELDGTNYETESYVPLKQDSKFNMSYVHPVSNNFFLKLSYVRGNTLSFGFSYKAPLGRKYPFNRKTEKVAPVPFKSEVRKVTSLSDENLYKATLLYMQQREMFVQGFDVKDETIKVAFSQSRYRIPSISAGRALKILNDISPDKIRKIEISEINGSMGMYKMSVDRSSLDKNEKFDDPMFVAKNASLSGVQFKKYDYKFLPDPRFPKFFYNIGPSIKSQIGGPDGFYFGDLRISASSEILFQRNLSLVSVFEQGITNNFDKLKLPSDSILPHVRTDIVDYLKKGDGFTITRMQLNHFLQPAKSIFFKFSAGLFESMFGGYGFEALYRPFASNHAIGLEAWRVKQREYNQLLKFRDYSTTTGHLTFYYREPKTDILIKLIGGRYLAKDSGITLDLSRRFYSGMQVGVFASKTDISREEFGEGSFDKGFYWWIPIDLFFQDYRRQSTGWGLTPTTRDGAQRVVHGYPLWGVTDNSSLELFNDHWGDFND